MQLRAFRKKTLRSPWGWPVPAEPRRVAPGELEELIQDAQDSGYSRQARGILISPDLNYVLVPILFEATPERAWICAILHLPPDLWKRPNNSSGAEESRIDVNVRKYRKLSRLSTTEKNRAIHFAAYVLMLGEMRKTKGPDAAPEADE